MGILPKWDGLIIGADVVDFLLRVAQERDTVKELLLTNVTAYLRGIFADLIYECLYRMPVTSKITPVEFKHLLEVLNASFS